MDLQSQDSKCCGICQESKSKYLCPKCGIPYCSLTCYRNPVKHLKCSESFYRDCVQEEIKLNERQNPEEARKMKEIIARVSRNAEAEDLFQTEQSSSSSPLLSSNKGPEDKSRTRSKQRIVEVEANQLECDEDDEGLDSDDDPPLEERIAGIDLEDSDTLWNALTPEEQEDFQRKIDDGSLLKIVYENEPPPDQELP